MSRSSSILRNIIRSKFQNSTKLRYITSINKHLKENKFESELDQSTESFSQETELSDDNEIIFDVYKERLKNYSKLLEEQEGVVNKFGNLNLNRGIFGVFDIEDLVETLQHQQAKDIFVANVPQEIKYVDYIVVVSGRSQRHMQAIAKFVKTVYKQKKFTNEIVPRIEGETSPDWMALDLGNIALHIFSLKARKLYDLDSLWAIGPKYDDECNKEDPISSMLEKHSCSLKGLEPAN